MPDLRKNIDPEMFGEALGQKLNQFQNYIEDRYIDGIDQMINRARNGDNESLKSFWVGMSKGLGVEQEGEDNG